MFEKLLSKIGYTSFYFVSYAGRDGLCGSMSLTVKPYIHKDNYKQAIQEISRLVGEEVAVTCISKL